MRPNPLRDCWSAERVSLGGWLTVPSAVTAEVVAAAGLDYVVVDGQHGLIDYSDSLSMLQAITTWGVTPVVRVLHNRPEHIGRALDAGAMAVIVPMVNSPEECEAAVRASRYAPAGSRSFGPTRAATVEGADYFDKANEQVALIPMIETAQALQSIDSIVSVDGVEAIYVGPADLAISLGFSPGSTDPLFLEALDQVVDSCRRHDVIPGIHANRSTVQDRLERGFQMVTVVTDLSALQERVTDDVAMVRDRSGTADPSPA
ncbi:MAG: aldolase/citrate lyase family protein [Acidimicrobiia bacterium]|nr:aldolase/citrate lyase family protein [Acidimicrobiia bacterium]